jgi:hypothetical protein
MEFLKQSGPQAPLCYDSRTFDLSFAQDGE